MNTKTSLLLILLLFAGCARMPVGPSVAVMPAPGKPFDLFVNDDAQCRGFAEQQIGVTPQRAEAENIAGGAVTGAALGAAAGTAIGALSGHIGPGAIAGAGLGLLMGAASGASMGHGAYWSLQQRFDIAYEQCMYAKGNQIPGSAVAYTQPAMPPPPNFGPPPPADDCPCAKARASVKAAPGKPVGKACGKPS
jgi:hypothetical protein